MKSRIILLLLISTCLLNGFALKGAKNDTDPVLLTVNKKPVHRSEFVRIYTKNNSSGSFADSAIRDYLELFENYKLKVAEAEALGYDTAQNFVQEFKGYRSQLVKPYMRDSATEENLIKEAHEHLKQEVHIKQIFLRCDQFASPADTLKVYNRLMEIRQRIEKGEVFDTLATNLSDDPNVRYFKGDMGYLTAFQTLYAFEEGMYNTPVGTMSMPVRTRVGYHLIQVIEKRPSRGEVRVAHIMATFPEQGTTADKDTVKMKIDTIYNMLKQGADFTELAMKYSDDEGSAHNGGELNWFSVGMMIPEFERMAFSLKKGEYSVPFRTAFGWHIMRKIDERPIADLSVLKDKIKQQITRDERANMPFLGLIAKLKKQYKYKEFSERVIPFYTIVDSSIFNHEWKAAKAGKLKQTLFTFANQTVTQTDFANYLAELPQRRPMSIPIMIDLEFKNFVNQKIQDYYDTQLETLYPDLGYLLTEYHDGILLFNLMEKEVWNKAMIDSAGLDAFYKKYNSRYTDIFKWTDRLIVLEIKGSDKEKVNQAYALALKDKSGSIAIADYWKQVCKNDTTCLEIKENLFEKGDQPELDSLGWETGITPVTEKDGMTQFYIKKGIKPAQPKTFDEARGLYIAEYQAYLEDMLLRELRKKYTVTVDEAVLKTVIK